MSNPTVSVVITSYNRADYLREAVDSIIGQSFKDFEIIIVDDGSTNNAPQIAAEYANQYDFISFIAQENAGVAAARTAGVKKAKGQYIAFQDDDDISHPNRLEQQATLLDSSADMAACVSNFAPIGEVIGTARKEKTAWMWQGTGHMIRRDAYLALGGYRSCFRLCEDIDFFLMFDEKYKYEFINEVLYYYRSYAPGTSNNLTNSSPLKIFPYAAAAFISAHCRRNKLPDPIKQEIVLDDILPHLTKLPADMRMRLLHIVRNAGRRLLARDEASNENMYRIREYIKLLSENECHLRAKKYCRWLAWQSLRYGQFNYIKLFLS